MRALQHWGIHRREKATHDWPLRVNCALPALGIRAINGPALNRGGSLLLDPREFGHRHRHRATAIVTAIKTPRRGRDSFSQRKNGCSVGHGLLHLPRNRGLGLSARVRADSFRAQVTHSRFRQVGVCAASNSSQRRAVPVRQDGQRKATVGVVKQRMVTPRLPRPRSQCRPCSHRSGAPPKPGSPPRPPCRTGARNSDRREARHRARAPRGPSG